MPLLIQPFVENAFVHGLEAKGERWGDRDTGRSEIASLDYGDR